MSLLDEVVILRGVYVFFGSRQLSVKINVRVIKNSEAHEIDELRSSAIVHTLYTVCTQAERELLRIKCTELRAYSCTIH